jgi:hypothetical protein
MRDIPIRNSKGGLDCPRCGTTMVMGKAPFYLNGEYIGTFEAMICDICNYSLFTPAGYDHAMEEASRYGLIGSPEEIIRESLEPSEQEVVFPEMVMSSTAKNTKQTITELREEVKANSLSNEVEVQILTYRPRERHQTMQTQVLVK